VKPPGRDPALDSVRGLLQVFILCSHAFGSFASLWLIHAAWGLSDSSEQFVFLSGLGLGSLFLYRRVRQGFSAATRDLMRRIASLWRMHMLVFLGFGLLVTAAHVTLGEACWAFALEQPLLALLGGALTLYQPPPFMGILPLFLLAMATLPAFSWLLDRFGDRALGLPAAMWAAAQFVPPDIPALGGTTIAFHPLAWVPLFWMGAWFGRRVLLEGRAVSAHPALIGAAAAMLALGLAMRLLHWTPDLLAGKEQLAPLRLLHAASCAYLVALALPRLRGVAETAAGRALATIGRNSLPAFCLGLFLSALCMLAFRHAPLPLALSEPLLLGGSIWLMWRFARHLETRRLAAAPRVAAQPG
jgi:hypothetical protein